MKVVFFGTPGFSASVLNYLIEKGIQIVGVISKPDKPVGRHGHPVPTPVKTVAETYKIPLFQPEKVSDPEFANTLQSLKGDLFVVVSYGEILKQHILDMPPLGCINLHFSLLPKYRGAAPIQHSIINGETESGVTIIHLVRKMDAGDIIKQTKIPIGPNDTFGQLAEKQVEIGSKDLFEVIQAFEKGTIDQTPQDHSQATLAPKIELEDCEIDWNKPALQLHNLIRGVNPYPGAWCMVLVKDKKLRLKIKLTRIVPAKSLPGSILSCDKEGMVVACGKDALLILELQLEGKKAMSPEELLRGTVFKFIA